MAVCCAPGGGWGPRGVNGVTMPSDWSNDELSSDGRAGRGRRSSGSSRTSSAASAGSSRSGSSATGRPTDRGPRARRPQQAREADRPRRPRGRADRVRHRARPPHRVGRAARHERRRTRPSASSSRAPRRARVSASINVEAVGLRAQVRVVLVDERPRAHRLRRRLGRERSARPQLVAAAALDALRQLEPAAEAIHIASAEISRDRQQPRRGGHRRLRRPADSSSSCPGSAVVRRDRDDAVARALLDATNRRLARWTERGAHRADPSSRVDPRESRVRCTRSPSSSRTGSAAPTAWPSRRASGSGRCASSASTCAASPASSTTASDPTTPGSRSSPSTRSTASTPDPDALAAAIAGADLVVVENLCSLPLNPDASTLTADGARRARRRASCSTTTTSRGNAPGSPHPDGIPPHRAELAARDDQRPLARAARAPRLRRGHRSATPSTSIRRAATATRHARAFGFAPDDLVLLQPTRAIPRKNVPAAVAFADRARAPRARAHRAALDHRARRGRLRRRASRGSSPTSTVPITVGRAPPRRRRVRRGRPRRLPVDLGGLRQPGDRVDRAPPPDRRRAATRCSTSSAPSACSCSRSTTPTACEAWLRRPRPRRARAQRRAASGPHCSLADLPDAIDAAFDAAGWTRRGDATPDDPVVARRARIARWVAPGQAHRLRPAARWRSSRSSSRPSPASRAGS